MKIDHPVKMFFPDFLPEFQKPPESFRLIKNNELVDVRVTFQQIHIFLLNQETNPGLGIFHSDSSHQRGGEDNIPDGTEADDEYIGRVQHK